MWAGVRLAGGLFFGFLIWKKGNVLGIWIKINQNDKAFHSRLMTSAQE